jgi:uncharacterized protein Yka (UPF0111/DUF47 family)
VELGGLEPPAYALLAVPFDRSDVLALASGLDEVVDFAE